MNEESSRSPLWRSRLLRWLFRLGLGVLILCALAVGILNLPPVTRALGREVGRIASEKSGMLVTCDTAQVLPGSLRLSNLVVQRKGQRLISFQSMTLHPRLDRLLRGELALNLVQGSGFLVTVSPPDKQKAEEPPASEKPRPPLLERVARFLDPSGLTVELREGTVRVLDEEAGALSIPVTLIDGLWPVPGRFPMRGTVLTGRFSEHEPLSVSAEILGKEEGVNLQVKGPGFPLEPFRRHLKAFLPETYHEKLDKGLALVKGLPAIGGDFKAELRPRAQTALIEGRVVVSEVVIEEEHLASQPVGPLTFDQEVKVQADAQQKYLEIARWLGKVNGAPYELAFTYQPTPDGPHVNFGFELKKAPYQAFVDAVPAGLMPAIKGIAVGGALDLSVAIDGNLEQPEKMNTNYHYDFSGLSLVTPSEQLRGDDPLEGFKYIPVSTDGIHREFILGRKQADWITIDQVPGYLINALLASEDINFYHHKGFDEEGLRYAVEVNLKAGKAVRGGSTITQQLAKNLFLNREKTLVRKLQEAVLTWELEQRLRKRQILEYYLNVIEWGPGFYGIGHAARHYFDKHPSQLSIRESVYLCSVIPNPVRYYVYFQRGEPTEHWNQRIQGTLDRMRGFQFITEEEYLAASVEWLYFRGSPRSPVDVSLMEEEDAAEQEGILEINPLGLPTIGLPDSRIGQPAEPTPPSPQP